MDERSKQIRPDGQPASGNPVDAHGRRTAVGVCVFLGAITLAVFGRTLRYNFVRLDDDKYVRDNPVVTGGLTFKGIGWALAHGSYDNWDPLTTISHMLDCQWYGLNAGGHHLTNVLLQAATAILLFLALRQMTGALWRSAFVAAVFAIHPLRVESVAWVSERKDVLSGLFFMLTLFFYAGYARRVTSGQPSPRFGTAGRCQVTGPENVMPASVWSRVTRHPSLFYSLAWLFFALGLMSKVMLVTVPLVLLLLDYWPLNRFARSGRAGGIAGSGAGLKPQPVALRLFIEKIPLLALALLAGMAVVLVQSRAILSLEQLSLPLRIGNALVSAVIYIGQMFWPAGLTVVYPYPVHGLPVWEGLSALLILSAVSVGALVWRRTHPYFWVGWLWYLVMLTPVIGLVQVGSQAHADRYTYLPQIGLYMALSWAAGTLFANWRLPRQVIGSMMAAIIAALGVVGFIQTSYWRNSETLWTHALAVTPDNVPAHNNLGVILFEQGRVDEAIDHYRKALAIQPDWDKALENLGSALLQKGQVNAAITEYQKALSIAPQSAKVRNYLGNAFLQAGRVDEAMENYRQAIQAGPTQPDGYYNLGRALEQSGNLQDAVRYYHEAVQRAPLNAEFLNHLGILYFRSGNPEAAIQQFQAAIRAAPSDAKSYSNLGNALLDTGRLDEAIQQYRKAIEIEPGFAQAHYNLGNALIRETRAGEAVNQYQKAIALQPQYVSALNNLAWVLATWPEASVRNGPQAVNLATQANQLSQGINPLVLRTLAAAYAETGRFSEAVTTAGQARELALRRAGANLANALQAQIGCYQAGAPFREAVPANSASRH
jgi:tetratricopeptide (TPR) repeat protein